MRLSDIVSHTGLTTYPIVGLVIFLAIFVLVSARALSRKRAAEYRQASMMPLAEETGGSPIGESGANYTGAGR